MVGLENHVFNVLVLGQTQSGKSSLISKLLQLSAKKVKHGPEIGSGGLSTTKDVRTYSLKLPFTEWQLIENGSGKEVKIPRDEESLFDKKKGLAMRENLLVEALHPEPECININLIDTPGLDDSDGEDALHICNVLKTLDENSRSSDPSLRYISAVLLVVKSTSAFSDKSKEILRYYERCMPSLFRGAALINTKFTVLEWQKDWKQARAENVGSILPILNTRKRKMQARCDALNKDFAFTDGRSRQHFFVDSRPRKDYPFEEYTTREQITDILRFIRYQPSMPIEQMWLCKFPDWLAVDAILIDWLRNARRLFDESQKNLLHKSSGTEKAYANNVKALQTCNSELDAVNQKLAMYDVETEYILTSETTSKSGLAVFANAIVLRGAGDTHTITETEVDQFNVTAENNDTGSWTRKDQTPASETWTGQYQGKWGKEPKLTICSWTTHREFYADKIGTLKQQQEKLNEQRGELTLTVSVLKPDAGADPRNEALTLGRFVGVCDDIIKKLNATELPLNDKTNGVALKRYQRRQNSDSIQVTPDDLYRVAYVADKELPYALSARSKEICTNSTCAVNEKSFWDDIDEVDQKAQRSEKQKTSQEDNQDKDHDGEAKDFPNAETSNVAGANFRDQDAAAIREGDQTTVKHEQDPTPMKEKDATVQQTIHMPESNDDSDVQKSGSNCCIIL